MFSLAADNVIHEAGAQHNVGVVRGGMTRECLEWRVGLVPDYAYALIDVRVVPGQTPGSVKTDLERVIARLAARLPGLQAHVDLMDRTRHLFMPAFYVSQKAEVIQATAAAHRSTAQGGEPQADSETPPEEPDPGELEPPLRELAPGHYARLM